MYRQGTVILVAFPFSDFSDDKVRPAVIVSKGLAGDELIAAFITSKTKVRSKIHVVSITPSDSNGLKLPSVVVCSKIATFSKKIILGELGTLSEENKKEVLKSVRVVLGL
jgi:mRNA interferase MazF